MTAEYPGAVWVPTDGRTGQEWKTTSRPKVVLHTTETGRWPSYTSPPHLTLDLAGTTPDGFGAVRQHVTLTAGAYSLRSPGRPHSPNADAGPVYQVELIGYAKDTPSWSEAQYNKLAELVTWLMDYGDVPLALPPMPFVGSAGYGQGATTRYHAFTDFAEFSGICGHAHVWHNSHWDPGDLHEDRLLDALTPGPSPAPPRPMGAVYPLRLGDDAGDVQLVRGLLYYLGHDVDRDSTLYDDELAAAVLAEFPKAEPNGARFTGKQLANVLKRAYG